MGGIHCMALFQGVYSSSSSSPSFVFCFVLLFVGHLFSIISINHHLWCRLIWFGLVVGVSSVRVSQVFFLFLFLALFILSEEVCLCLVLSPGSFLLSCLFLLFSFLSSERMKEGTRKEREGRTSCVS